MQPIIIHNIIKHYYLSLAECCLALHFACWVGGMLRKECQLPSRLRPFIIIIIRVRTSAEQLHAAVATKPQGFRLIKHIFSEYHVHLLT